MWDKRRKTKQKKNKENRRKKKEDFSDPIYTWKNRKGGTAQGGTSKMCSWTRVRRNSAFAAPAQGFYLFDYRNKAFWYVSKPVGIHLGCVSMRASVAFGSGPRGVPPSAVPPLCRETPGQLQGSKTPKPEIPRKKLKNYPPDPDPKFLEKN